MRHVLGRSSSLTLNLTTNPIPYQLARLCLCTTGERTVQQLHEVVQRAAIEDFVVQAAAAAAAARRRRLRREHVQRVRRVLRRVFRAVRVRQQPRRGRHAAVLQQLAPALLHLLVVRPSQRRGRVDQSIVRSRASEVLEKLRLTCRRESNGKGLKP
jgi:hypothetical protein